MKFWSSMSGIAVTIGSLLSAAVVAAAPQIPGPEQTSAILLAGVTVHPIEADPVENVDLLFAKGRIVGWGSDLKVPAGTETIELAGRHVYPALFNAYSQIGLTEINAVRATRDRLETGRINSNVAAAVAVNPDSEIIPVTRSNGILLSLTAPESALLGGTSAILQLDGWTWEDMTLARSVGMHVKWPSQHSAGAHADARKKGRASYLKVIDELRQAFHDARAYQRAREADPTVHPRDLRWDALLPVLAREIPLVVSADRVEQIEAAVAFAQAESVRLIIHGGYDAERCAELLRNADVPVIVAGTHRLPLRRSDDYDRPYTIPAMLHKLKVSYCIASSGRFGASNARNLPYHAATAAAYGLPAKEALKAVTLYPAQIWGVADRVGSLAPGKHATLIVTDGDPLETTTQVERAFVQGRPVDLSSRHTQLWKKYQEKYRQKARQVDNAEPVGP